MTTVVSMRRQSKAWNEKLRTDYLRRKAKYLPKIVAMLGQGISQAEIHRQLKVKLSFVHRVVKEEQLTKRIEA